MANKNFTLIVSFQELVDYINTVCDVSRDTYFYSYILDTLMLVLLNDDDLGDFKTLLSYYKNITGLSDFDCLETCNMFLTIAIECLTKHIALDHPMFKYDYDISFNFVGCIAYVNFKENKT